MQFSSFVQNFARSSDDVDCFSSNRTEYEQCLPTFDEYQQNVSKCCRICDACAFVECPDNAVCQDGSCTCSDGFEPTDDGLCAGECGTSLGLPFAFFLPAHHYALVCRHFWL